jgi:hypothetical protein
MISIINPIEQRETFYVQPETRAIGVWQIGGKTISVNKESESLRFFEDGKAKKIPTEALGFYGRDPIPEEFGPNCLMEEIQKRKLEILEAKKKQLMENIFIIDRFRSVIKKNIEDSVRFDGSLGLKGYLNFIPVLEKEGYTAITRRGKTIYRPLENIRVALFGMVDPRTKTMIFARWCVLNNLTNEMQCLSIKEKTSEAAFKFLKNLNGNEDKCERFSRNFKPILEVEDERIINIAFHCFSEADPNAMISEQKGAITVISQTCNLSSEPYMCNTGHAMIWYEYLDFNSFEKPGHFAHITNRENYQGVRRTIPGGMGKPEIKMYIKKNMIEKKGPTWIIPIENVKKLESTIKTAMIMNQRVPFSMYSDVVDTSVSLSFRGYFSYVFDGSKYLAPIGSMWIAGSNLGAVCAEGYVAAGVAGGAAAGGTVLGFGAVAAVGSYKIYSHVSSYLSDKVTQWQNRDKTDDYSRNCMSWVRHQLTIAGIKISVPNFNFTPKNVINHLNAHEESVQFA